VNFPVAWIIFVHANQVITYCLFAHFFGFAILLSGKSMESAKLLDSHRYFGPCIRTRLTDVRHSNACRAVFLLLEQACSKGFNSDDDSSTECYCRIVESAAWDQITWMVWHSWLDLTNYDNARHGEKIPKKNMIGFCCLPPSEASACAYLRLNSESWPRAGNPGRD
jgi:hypothetical protein